MINCSEDIAISINEIVFKKISNHMELYTYRYVCDKSFLFTFNLGVSIYIQFLLTRQYIISFQSISESGITNHFNKVVSLSPKL